MIGISPRQAVAALILFGIAFGFVEASVVVYLRHLTAPYREAAGLAPYDLFPLLVGRELRAHPVISRIEHIELIREVATLLMLWAAGMAIGRTPTARFAAFLVAFGWWDIFFYLGLKLTIDWPASIMTPDILFLVPVPWWGPVLSPVLAATVMVIFGTLYLFRPFDVRPLHWTGILGGGLVMVGAFAWDAKALLAGAVPQEFNWPLYLCGLAATLVAGLHAARSFSRADMMKA